MEENNSTDFENQPQTPKQDKEPNREKDLEVHTLPEKFLRPKKAKKQHIKLSPLRIGLIVVGVLVLLLVVGSYLLLTLLKDEPAVVVNENLNENLNISLVNDVISNENVNALNLNMNLNENQNTNVNKNSNINENLNGNLNSNTNVNENLNGNLNSNINSNVNANTNTSIIVPMTQDTDEDGLTDQEEALYDTNDSLKDTDGDGFVDGLEVMNGYSPLLIPGTQLVETDYATTYSNVTHTFSINHPSNWIVDARTANEILFITSTTEFIEILIEAKRDFQSIEEWYDEQVSSGGSSDLTVTQIGPLTGLISKNGLTYYIGDENKVFVMTYNFGTREKVNYKTSFNMMVDSFVREIIVTPPTNTNINTNANTNTNSNTNTNINGNSNANINTNTNSSNTNNNLNVAL